MPKTATKTEEPTLDELRKRRDETEAKRDRLEAEVQKLHRASNDSSRPDYEVRRARRRLAERRKEFESAVDDLAEAERELKPAEEAEHRRRQDEGFAEAAPVVKRLDGVGVETVRPLAEELLRIQQEHPVGNLVGPWAAFLEEKPTRPTKFEDWRRYIRENVPLE